MTRRLLIACLLAVCAWSQEPGEAIVGQVLSASDDSPISGALVMVRGRSVQKTWTGPDGRFRLTGPGVDASFGLTAMKAGFHPYPPRRTSTANQQGEEIVIRLTPESLIAGTAFGADGAPLEGAKVQLWEQPDQLGNLPTLVERRQAVVDDLGRFRLYGLRAGNYLIGLEPAATPAPQGADRLTAAPMLYPEPSSSADLATVRLRPGERLENVDFRAADPGRTALAGQVSGCGTCEVGLYRRSGDFFAPVYRLATAADGSFLVQGLSPGAYVIAARGRGRGPDPGGVVGLAEVALAADQTTRATVYLSEGTQMKVTKTHLNPPEWIPESQRTDAGPPAVMLEYLGPQLVQGMQGSGGLRRQVTGASEYEVSLAPGPYAIRVRGIPSGGYLSSVLVDGSPPLNGRFVIGDGGEHETEVLIAYDSGTVEGTVSAAEGVPLKDAQVYLLPQNPVLPSDVSGAGVDETGAFTVKVAPGRYDVYALPRDTDWNLANSQDRQRLVAYRASVDVRSGQTATVKVKLSPFSSW